MEAYEEEKEEDALIEACGGEGDRGGADRQTGVSVVLQSGCASRWESGGLDVGADS